MAKVGSKNSKPEVRVRQMLHAMGYRFRLHAKELLGSPDIIFRPRKKAIFVHGCFWHRHPGCSKTTMPKTRREFWQSKFAANHSRDARVQIGLREMGWRYLVIWECETTDEQLLARRLRVFLG
jgi:DNA mismatch endonuclease, patch repair protein